MQLNLPDFTVGILNECDSFKLTPVNSTPLGIRAIEDMADFYAVSLGNKLNIDDVTDDLKFHAMPNRGCVGCCWLSKQSGDHYTNGRRKDQVIRNPGELLALGPPFDSGAGNWGELMPDHLVGIVVSAGHTLAPGRCVDYNRAVIYDSLVGSILEVRNDHDEVQTANAQHRLDSLSPWRVEDNDENKTSFLVSLAGCLRAAPAERLPRADAHAVTGMETQADVGAMDSLAVCPAAAIVRTRGYARAEEPVRRPAGHQFLRNLRLQHAPALV